ncbi:MAG: hypothetical protein ACW981_02450 [Candidatus Hodarchaeales archaeon]|jgi:hypothetical protein
MTGSLLILEFTDSLSNINISDITIEDFESHFELRVDNTSGSKNVYRKYSVGIDVTFPPSVLGTSGFMLEVLYPTLYYSSDGSIKGVNGALTGHVEGENFVEFFQTINITISKIVDYANGFLKYFHWDSDEGIEFEVELIECSGIMNYDCDNFSVIPNEDSATVLTSSSIPIQTSDVSTNTTSILPSEETPELTISTTNYEIMFGIFGLIVLIPLKRKRS